MKQPPSVKLSGAGGAYLFVYPFAAAIAALWVVRNIGVLTTDWPVKSPDQLRPHILVAVLSIPILALLLSSITIHGRSAARAFLARREGRAALAVFTVIFSAYAVLILGVSPGFWPEDAMYTHHMVRAGWWSGWYSPVHPFLVTMLMHWIPSPTGLTLTLAFFVAFVIAAVVWVSVRLGASVVLSAGVALVTATMPPIVFTALLPIRDSFFTASFVLFCLAVFGMSLRGNLTPGRLALLGGVAGLVSAYRIDALPAALLAPALMGALRAEGWRGALRPVGAYFGVLLLVIIGVARIPAILGQAWDGRAEREYRLTLIANPLGYLVRTGFVSRTAEADKQVIERVFTYENLAKHWYPYNIAVFYGGHWNQASTDAERNAAFRVALKLFLNNPGRFLESRILSFVPATGLAPNEPFDYYTPERARGSRVHGVEAPLAIQKAGRAVERWLVRTQEFRGPRAGRFVSWNLAFWICVLGVAVFLWRLVPATAVFAALLLVRAAAVFVGAPSTFVHYYFSVFLGGMLVLALGVGEYAWRRGVDRQGRRPADEQKNLMWVAARP